MRLIQLNHPEQNRRIAVVKTDQLNLIDPAYPTCYDLFSAIISNDRTPAVFIPEVLTGVQIDYDPVYRGGSDWKIMPAFDHPRSPLMCMLSGTGLTHKASAENRQNMHQKKKGNELTDSMKIYLWGQEAGKPDKGNIGVQPEWFYKGNGTSLKACGEPLQVPPYANDGGEEPEIAGIYLISEKGVPFRVGFAIANEFSDHIMEKKNYLYLAPSKLRECAIGPELILDHEFRNISGRVSIQRDGEEIWSETIKSGETNMCHSLENLEHHDFKYDQHRIPGTVHIHFFGADAFSFGAGVKLEDGDLMAVEFEEFGRPLTNPVNINPENEALVRVSKP
jgi:hypothetical protein